MNTDTKAIEIQFPHDALWQDADPDDYDQDATEEFFADSVVNALEARGYTVEFVWAHTTDMRILDDDGAGITDRRYDEIRHIINSVGVEYVQIEE